INPVSYLTNESPVFGVGRLFHQRRSSRGRKSFVCPVTWHGPIYFPHLVSPVTWHGHFRGLILERLQ
ncbi:hypothetical protein MKW94_008773, partial [Papaver nudicaule]|nr:hypothetical protein [Papaver nudicaule]